VLKRKLKTAAQILSKKMQDTELIMKSKSVRVKKRLTGISFLAIPVLLK
jgi:hypothetical protein